MGWFPQPSAGSGFLLILEETINRNRRQSRARPFRKYSYSRKVWPDKILRVSLSTPDKGAGWEHRAISVYHVNQGLDWLGPGMLLKLNL